MPRWGVGRDAARAPGGQSVFGQVADGNGWRLQYNDNGYFFVNTTNGFNGSGKWHTEMSRLCGELIAFMPR